MAQQHSERLLHQQKSRMVLCCASNRGRISTLSEINALYKALLSQLYTYLINMFCCQGIVQAPSNILRRIYSTSNRSKSSYALTGANTLITSTKSYPAICPTHDCSSNPSATCVGHHTRNQQSSTPSSLDPEDHSLYSLHHQSGDTSTMDREKRYQ